MEAENTRSLIFETLHDQLIRLSNEDLTVDEIEKEVKRSNAINSTVDHIVDVCKVYMEAAKIASEYDVDIKKIVPRELTDGSK